MAAMPYTVTFTFDEGVNQIIWSNDVNLIVGNYITTSPETIDDGRGTIAFVVGLKSGYDIENVAVDELVGNDVFEIIDENTHSYKFVTDGGGSTVITITTKQSGGR